MNDMVDDGGGAACLRALSVSVTPVQRVLPKSGKYLKFVLKIANSYFCDYV
jgi:hypothetical protein